MYEYQASSFFIMNKIGTFFCYPVDLPGKQ